MGISELEVGSHRWYNKRQFSSLFFFWRRVLVVVQASCSGGLISSWSHSNKPFVSVGGFVDIYVPGERIYFIIIIPNNGAHAGTEMGHTWIISFCVCILTPLSLRSIFRCCKEALHYSVFDKVLAELCSCGATRTASSREMKTQKLVWSATEVCSEKLTRSIYVSLQEHWLLYVRISVHFIRKTVNIQVIGTIM